MSGPLLHITHETIGHAVVVHVAGEVDIITAPEVLAELTKACARAHPSQIVVADLSAVNFLGSAGLGVLLDVDQRCREQRTPLRVVAALPGVLRPLEVSGLTQVLDVARSLDKVIQSA